jgi:hypothetical protein
MMPRREGTGPRPDKTPVGNVDVLVAIPAVGDPAYMASRITSDSATITGVRG